MAQEDKQLLLKDLCARLPYGVKVLNMAEGVNEVCELDSIMTSRKHKDKVFVSLTLPDDSVLTGIEMIKPYLRPMSSMTKEEKHIFDTMTRGYTIHQQAALFDWLNAHHFDYRGFIELGPALEAPKDMYNLKDK